MDEILNTAPKKTSEANELTGALKFMHNEESSRVRQLNLGRNYLAGKLQRLLTEGGFDNNYGRRLSLKANNLDIQNDPSATCKQDLVEEGTFLKDIGEAFDSTHVCKISIGDDEAHTDVAKALFKMRTAMKQTMDKKVADITKAVTKKDWRSGMARIEHVPDGLCDMDTGLDDMKLFVNDLGAHPWVLAVKANAWCFGPAEFSLPGVACFVSALKHRLWISCFKVQPLVEQGLSVQDLKVFFRDGLGRLLREGGQHHRAHRGRRERLHPLRRHPCCDIPVREEPGPNVPTKCP